MSEIINIALALLTIALGAFGLLAPRYTASVLDLKTGETNMGLSELRASVGGLFVALGLFALIDGTPMAYVVMGVAYAGAAIGRLVSICLDDPPFRKALLYFGFEAIPATYLILANL